MRGSRLGLLLPTCYPAYRLPLTLPCMTIALARRYRPKRFADLIVQDHVAAVLRGAVARHRVGHGYLLTGPRGVGKTTAARILAMALNCERPASARDEGEPCGECESCLRIWSGAASLDVVEIDAASNRGVDDARDLRERARYAASQPGHYKVYIVDEAHMLTREAWNALLKILEEPPPGVVFVFATTEPQKIAATAAPVMSRLQRFDFRRIGPTAIRERLTQVLAAESIACEPDALTLIARHADGGMRDALSLLDQCLSFGEGAITSARVREVLGLVTDESYEEVLTLVVERRPAGIFPLVDRLVDAGLDLPEYVNGLAEALRALLMLQLGAEAEGLTEAMRRLLAAYRDRLEAGDVLRMLKLLADNETAIRRSSNSRIAVETLLLRWTMMDRIVDLQEVIAGEGRAGLRPTRMNAAPSLPPSPPQPGPAFRDPGPPARGLGVEVPGGGAGSEGGLSFALEALREHWADLVAAARERSPLLGEALAVAIPIEVKPPILLVTVPPEHAVFQVALERRREVVEEVIGRRVGAPVKLAIRTGPSDAAASLPPKRLSDSEARSEQLRSLRSIDRTLDAVADELDLEIVD